MVGPFVEIAGIAGIAGCATKIVVTVNSPIPVIRRFSTLSSWIQASMIVPEVSLSLSRIADRPSYQY
jgi:hypothetical protein